METLEELLPGCTVFPEPGGFVIDLPAVMRSVHLTTAQVPTVSDQLSGMAPEQRERQLVETVRSLHGPIDNLVSDGTEGQQVTYRREPIT